MTGATTLVDGWEYARDEDAERSKPVPSDGPLMWKSITEEFVAVITMFGKYKSGTSSLTAEPGFARLSCVRPEPHVEDKGEEGQVTANGKGDEKGDAKSDDKSDQKGDEKGNGAGTVSAASVLLVAVVFVLLL